MLHLQRTWSSSRLHIILIGILDYKWWIHICIGINIAMKIYSYIDAITALYDHVKDSPFYSSEVASIFKPNKIQMLVGKGYLAPTGNTKIVHAHTRNQYKFTKEGIYYVNRYREDE